MERVLVVDDDRLICWSLERALSREGYRVSAVESAETALTEFEARPFEVAIVDVVLPGMDGMELIGRVRSVCPGTKFIVITGYGSRDVEKRALDHGTFAYVEKPFSVRGLVGMVRTILSSPGMA
jgi:DNA-binding NtrC family response regulator